MNKAEWEKLYRDAWAIYYTPEHIETILRRAQAYGINILRLAQIILWFAASLAVEKVHPLQGGFLRSQSGHERRPDCRSIRYGSSIRGWRPTFWSNTGGSWLSAWAIFRIYRRVAADAHIPYTDQAMMPVTDEDTAHLELFTHNQSARQAVDDARKIKTLTTPPRPKPRREPPWVARCLLVTANDDRCDIV